jgi:hypothetical protein
MLPTKTELNFARKGNFDLYTITNLSFMDLAMAMKIKPNLFAVVKSDLANRDEHLEVLEMCSLLVMSQLLPLKQRNPKMTTRKYH